MMENLVRQDALTVGLVLFELFLILLRNKLGIVSIFNKAIRFYKSELYLPSWIGIWRQSGG